MNKLSIENQSKASSKRSNRSDSKKSFGSEKDIRLDNGAISAKTIPSSPAFISPHKKKIPPQQLIDSFLKEFGFFQQTSG
mmetsp:Transcript_35080/g.34111  ORF Transcript_35080/g.34111 Transcript_35080/m.34111 type:complete len:80 (+) Transcript_35080:2371-2610(+)